MKKIVFFISFAFFTFQFFAQDNLPDASNNTITLTVDDAVKNAMENNISIKDAYLSLKNLEIKNKYSWNSASPTLNVSGSFADDFENETSSFGISGTIGLGLSMNLYTQIQGARLNYERGKITYEQACRQIEKTVRQNFYVLLYKKEYLKLQERSLETSLVQYKNNQEKYKSGQISELDVKTSQVNYQQKKPTVEQARIDFADALSSFKQILGIDQQIEIALDGSLDDVLNKVKSVTFESLPKVDEPAPDVRIAEKNVEIAKNTLLSNKFSAYGPTLTASYTYGKTKQSKEVNGTDLSTTNRLSVGVNIPLDGYFPWSNGAATIATQKNTLESAKNALEDAKTTIMMKTESNLRKINQAIAQVESLKANSELAEETYEMTLTAYNYGKTDFLNLQTANDNVLSAGVSLKQQAYNLVSSLLELEYLLGIEFGSLSQGEI